MKATNQTKQVQVVTIEIDDPAEVAALQAELVRYSSTTGALSTPVMATLAKAVVDAIRPKPTYRGQAELSPTARVMSEPRAGTGIRRGDEA